MVCEKSVEICEICGRQLSAQCAKEQAGCFYSPTDLSDKHRCHADCLSITQIAPSARQMGTDLFAGGEGFIMGSVGCGMLDVEWVYNGERGTRRLCLCGAKCDNGIKKWAPMGCLKRKKSYLCCKMGAPITAWHNDWQGGRGKSDSSMTGSIQWRSTDQWRSSTQ